MPKSLLLIGLLLLSASLADARKKSEPQAAAFPEITARGRMLADYLTVAARARQAVLGLNFPTNSVTHYVAQKQDSGWVVAFGRYNEKGDQFQIAFEATPGASPEEFTAQHFDPPRQDAGFFLLAAKALDTAGADFRAEKVSLRYEAAVIPAEASQMYVYFLPAQTSPAVYIYGGDFRYLVSPDGSKIAEKRQLHKTVLKSGQGEIPAGATAAGGYHTHILSDVPEGTDVVLVLLRKPSVPEFVGGGKGVYEIQEGGTIVRVQ